MLRGATVCLATGLGFFVVGSAELIPTLIRSPHAFVGVVLCTSAVSGVLLHRSFRSWGNSRRVQQNLKGASPLAADWIPMLYGDYTPYVVEAAQHLGDAKETTAVPALMHVLDRTVNRQPPGWCDSAEAMVVALGKMGDRRALSLLHRLSNVRVIGLLTVVHEAIDRIEPETSLLRPGSAEGLPAEILLRPAAACSDPDPATLLRAESSGS